MEAKTKSGFTVIQMVEIPADSLHKEVEKAMCSRSIYIDSEELNELICSGDVFDQILIEQEENDDDYRFKMSSEALKQVKELAEECKNYELIRVNKI